MKTKVIVILIIVAVVIGVIALFVVNDYQVRERKEKMDAIFYDNGGTSIDEYVDQVINDVKNS